MLPGKKIPRHLPTLTHVVTQAEWDIVDSKVPMVVETTNVAVDELRVQEIIQSLMPTISARWREAVDRILDEKLHYLEANMKAEVEAMVRKAIKGCAFTPQADKQ